VLNKSSLIEEKPAPTKYKKGFAISRRSLRTELISFALSNTNEFPVIRYTDVSALLLALLAVGAGLGFLGIVAVMFGVF
jgi:hypothetical protein